MQKLPKSSSKSQNEVHIEISKYQRVAFLKLTPKQTNLRNRNKQKQIPKQFLKEENGRGVDKI